MRADGSGKKKLIVAFHFQFANQAGWECDDCRKAGLEKRRRCGWAAAGDVDPPRVVWARKDVSLETCPKSYITGQSLAWVEEFVVRRRLGDTDTGTLDARRAEAFVLLEREWEAEERERPGPRARH